MSTPSSSNVSAPQQQQQPQQQHLEQFRLNPEEELRVEASTPVTLTLLDGGTAEIFGTELAVGRAYSFSHQNLAVFSWHGCTIEVRGDPVHVYKASDTPMPTYANIHFALETMREQAESSGSLGPRLVICGPVDSGKSSLSSILLGYATKRGRRPLFVDLDIGQGTISCPGVLAASVVDQPADVEDGLRVSAPLAYYFGHVSPTENPRRFRGLVEKLVAGIEARMAHDPVVRCSGLICNTMGWVDDLGYELLVHTCKSLQATSVVVIDHDRLYTDLDRHLNGPLAADPPPQPASAPSPVALIKVPKSGGVVSRPTAFRRSARFSRIRTYFHGPRDTYSPARGNLKFDEIRLFRIWGGKEAPRSALPLGAAPTFDTTRLLEVGPGPDCLNSLVAVVYARSEEDLPTANVAGFLHIVQVDLTTKTLAYLSPMAGPLPSKFLIMGSLKWIEQ
ncbi:putative Protein CLP1 [Paratrimastix pyriformis]|uniref:Protein CLP1 homolog n=1 Tax=Paratrimastix pyriformis TaxID=342808 RepID=A0ABQ8UU00_9EUKA|nr:putative Protein CLP1 [Paratrimastix pyriformis]